MFSKYEGSLPLAETSIGDIPLEEQRAFFHSKGWPWGLAFVPDEQDDEMYAVWAAAQQEFAVSNLAQSGVDAETLDRVEVLYEVKASFVINASVSSGVLTTDNMAALIYDRGIHADDIDSMSIIEINIDDKVIARA